MYLHSKLEDHKGNINIAFIGCGKFISMFLSQYNQLKKIKIDTIVDLDIERAKSNCIKSGLTKETIEQIYFVNSLDNILDRNIEIFIEATGNPILGTQHAYKVIQSKKNIKYKYLFINNRNRFFKNQKLALVKSSINIIKILILNN